MSKAVKTRLGSPSSFGLSSRGNGGFGTSVRQHFQAAFDARLLGSPRWHACRARRLSTVRACALLRLRAEWRCAMTLETSYPLEPIAEWKAEGHRVADLTSFAEPRVQVGSVRMPRPARQERPSAIAKVVRSARLASR